ncbi:MAG TPA: xanthine dehydrogenase small subunit [Afifellaceae bacterium]|nr:xanthine dehydrogenase small subunit [Afifellaceae bacterium]
MEACREIRFLLGEEPRALSGVSPTLTVLEYLRRTERLTGTKEGCAEGDCGACTVVVGEQTDEGRMRYRPVNACIQFVPSLHGRQLLTVEHLRGEEGRLHPVQQALVDHHGSQCGFCTPGFVMSLYAAWRTRPVSDGTGLKDWLAGNLCRCTGYGPILAAGEAALGAALPDLSEEERRSAEALARLDTDGMLAMEHEGQRWFAPRSADELAALYSEHPDAILVAGATDVGLWVTKQHRRLETLIDVSRVPELQQVEERDDELVLGAAVPLSQAGTALARLHPDLGELSRRFASPPIRGAGTIGGNIANGSPIGDWPPALIALGATLVLRQGEARRALPLADFFIAHGRQDRAPGEFVECLRVPRLAADARFACYKLSKRFDQDISAVMAAIHVRLVGGRVAAARVAFGGMAATPMRARAAEAALSGAEWSEASVEGACAALEQDFQPIGDMRASAAYRRIAAKNLLRRFWLENGADDRPRTRILELADG